MRLKITLIVLFVVTVQTGMSVAVASVAVIISFTAAVSPYFDWGANHNWCHETERDTDTHRYRYTCLISIFDYLTSRIECTTWLGSVERTSRSQASRPRSVERWQSRAEFQSRRKISSYAIQTEHCHRDDINIIWFPEQSVTKQCIPFSKCRTHQ